MCVYSFKHDVHTSKIVFFSLRGDAASLVALAIVLHCNLRSFLAILVWCAEWSHTDHTSFWTENILKDTQRFSLPFWIHFILVHELISSCAINLRLFRCKMCQQNELDTETASEGVHCKCFSVLHMQTCLKLIS